MKIENRKYSVLVLVSAIFAGGLFFVLSKNNVTDEDILKSRSSVNSTSQVSSDTQILKKEKNNSNLSIEKQKINDIQNEGLPNKPKLTVSKIVDVHGQVTDKQGKGIGGMQVEISSGLASLTQKQLYTSISDDNGNFIIHGLAPGDEYQLEVLALGAYAGTRLKPLSIKENMGSIAIVVDSLELISLDGTIVGTDYTPVVGFEILIRNMDIAYPGDKIVTDDAGFFQLSEFPVGNIHMSTSGDEHFEVTGITLLPDVYRNLTLVLDKGLYELSGQISDSFEQPIAQARVVSTSIFSGDHYQSSSYRLRVTDKNGNFIFTGLGEWDHKLVIDAPGYQTVTINYNFQTLEDELLVTLQRN